MASGDQTVYRTCRRELQMKTVITLIVLSASLWPVEAQWANYPTPNIPRTADGKPNLSAPSPRTAAGKPDLSGLWEKISNYGNNVAADLKPADIQPWAQALVKSRLENLGKDHMIPQCLPMGPGYITDGGTTAGGITKIIQTPTLIIFLSQDMTYRQIYMDGRTLEANPNPSWMGYSVGHWEGDTLVVESNGYNDKTWLDRSGHPHTEALRTIERYRRPDFGHLEYTLTLEDPAVYAKPWTLTMGAKLAADTEIIEYVCAENAQSALKHWAGKASDDEKAEVKVAPEILAKYVGTYKTLDVWNNEPEPRFIEITVSDGVLYGELKGRGKVRLVAQTETMFTGFYGLGIKFLLDGQGKVTHLAEMHVSGDYRFIPVK
jgi:hypothetical protein